MRWWELGAQDVGVRKGRWVESGGAHAWSSKWVWTKKACRSRRVGALTADPVVGRSHDGKVLRNAVCVQAKLAMRAFRQGPECVTGAAHSAGACDLLVCRVRGEERFSRFAAGAGRFPEPWCKRRRAACAWVAGYCEAVVARRTPRRAEEAATGVALDRVCVPDLFPAVP